jgi:hypothetical protein
VRTACQSANPMRRYDELFVAATAGACGVRPGVRFCGRTQATKESECANSLSECQSNAAL